VTLSQNQKVVTRLIGVIVFMGALAWASVPLYDWFCRVTGFGGTTQVATEESDTVLDETIRVRFDASLARDMPWTFRPVEPHMDVRIGETGWPSTRRTTRPTGPSPARRASTSRPSRPAAIS
jgi:cytochrome c oxidase assembly protein subunit 11